MAEVRLKADPRPGTGKGVARKARAAGKIPGVLYGRGVEARPLLIDARDLRQVLHTEAGRNVLIDLELDGENHLALPREIQRHPLRGDYLHVDFLKVARDVAIQVDVPIHLVGEAKGTKEGGILEQHLGHVRIQCLPTEVPNAVEAGVAALEVGDALRVEDLVAPPGSEILNDPNEVIVSVVIPRIVEVEAPPEEELLVEGEVPPEAAAEGEAAPAAEPEGGEPEE